MKKKTYLKHCFCLLMMVLFFGMGISVPSIVKAEENTPSIPQAKILECVSIDYNAIAMRLENPGSSYDIEIYRSTSKNGTYKLIDTILANGSRWGMSNGSLFHTLGQKKAVICYRSNDEKEYYLADQPLSFQKKYYYKLRFTSSYSKNSGEYSEPAAIAAKLGKATLTDGQFSTGTAADLKWQKVNGAQGYQIYRKESGKSWKRIAVTKKSSVLSYSDKTISAGKTYSYKIKAYRKAGSKVYTGAFSNTYIVKTTAPTVSGTYQSGSVYGPSLNATKLLQVRRVVQSFKDNHIRKGMSDYDKIWAAYSYLRSNCVYARRGWQYNDANTAWGALIYGEAQCSGFARAMKALCDAIGIKCNYVHATSGSHQWNEVKIGGKWYLLDAQGGFFLVGADTYKNMGLHWNTGTPVSKNGHKRGGFTGSIF